jgi:PHD/YefM family antitoxin component YafN of YafNO toxin-antitoxin module
VQTGEPAVILQRSKPVAYIVKSSTYEEMLKKLDTADQYLLKAEREKTLKELAEIRRRMAARGRQPDSVPLIRELREGKHR